MSNLDNLQTYVYSHIDPDTRETVYIGMGTNWRAWATGTARNPNRRDYGRRRDDHQDWLDKMYEKGYLPDDWVRILYRGLTKERASELEVQLIKELLPRYNKNHNKTHTDRRQATEEQIATAKALRQMNYSYDKIAHIMDASSPMTAWRLCNAYYD